MDDEYKDNEQYSVELRKQNSVLRNRHHKLVLVFDIHTINKVVLISPTANGW
jgi:hypothetical protein